MIRHKQLYRHEPNRGIYGDCPDSLMAVGILQAAIRKLLDGRIIE